MFFVINKIVKLFCKQKISNSAKNFQCITSHELNFTKHKERLQNTTKIFLKKNVNVLLK